MKFASALTFFLFAGSLTSSSAVTVVKDFLSQDECEEILKKSDSSMIVNQQSYEQLHRSKISVSDKIKTRLTQAMAYITSNKCSEEDQACLVDAKAAEIAQGDYDHELYLSSIIRTTKPHQDHLTDRETGERSVVSNDSKVGFVFLEDSDQAYFSHGDSQVAIEKGKLVTFDGAVKHNTVVTGGSPIHLLGPFTLTNSGLSVVGAAPDPESKSKSKGGTGDDEAGDEGAESKAKSKSKGGAGDDEGEDEGAENKAKSKGGVFGGRGRRHRL